MSNVFEFVAASRGNSGKGAAKAVRREGRVPAILYGGSAAPAMLSFKHSDIIKHLEHEAVYSHILDVTIDGKTEKAVLKDIQRHPAKPQILHMDFMRVSETDTLKVHVPLHFINEATSVGVKKGGIATHARVEVEVSCLASALPEYIEVDLAKLDLGESIHLSQISLPAGVEIVELSHGEDHDLAVVSIAASRAAKAADDEEESAE